MPKILCRIADPDLVTLCSKIHLHLNGILGKYRGSHVKHDYLFPNLILETAPKMSDLQQICEIFIEREEDAWKYQICIFLSICGFRYYTSTLRLCTRA